jgi:hypothetical protein
LCLWDTAAQARVALSLPRHQAAARLAHRMYERFRLERYQVERDGRDGRTRISPVGPPSP